MNKKTQERRARQTELLKLFPKHGGYAEKRVGDKWYVRQYNGGTKRWQVAVYTLDSFKRYKAFSGYRKPTEMTQAQRKAKYDETVAYHEAKRLEKELDEQLQQLL